MGFLLLTLKRGVCSLGKCVRAVSLLASAVLAADSRVHCSYSREEGISQAAAEGALGIPVPSDAFLQNVILQQIEL